MKRLLIFAASLLMLSSCGFTGNRQGENSVEPQPVEKVPQVASTSEGADRSAVNLDEAKEVLKEILGSIAESMQRTDSTSVSEEPVEEEIPEKEPARELKWYEKD